MKELVLCSLLLASRRIVQGAAHVDKMLAEEPDPAMVKTRVEKEKTDYGGQELSGTPGPGRPS